MTRLPALALVLVVLAVTGTPDAAPRDLDDLMMAMNIAPFDAQPPPPLAVTTLDGGRVSLAEVKGRAALVYFWATW
jgi:hypothetical protein